MNKLALLLVTSSLLSSAYAQETNKMQTATVRLTISGTIKNFDKFVALVEPETYIQLVPLPADGRIGGTTDSQGRWAYNSELPKLPIPKKAAFIFVVPNTQPGRYFLAVQRSSGVYPPLFVTDKGERFIIDFQRTPSPP